MKGWRERGIVGGKGGGKVRWKRGKTEGCSDK